MKKAIILLSMATFISFGCATENKESEKHKRLRIYWETIVKSATMQYEPKYRDFIMNKIEKLNVDSVKMEPVVSCKNRWIMKYSFVYENEYCRVVVPMRYSGNQCNDSSSLFFEEYKRSCYPK